jgi:membrane protease YdiL (CAAX protease family)
MSTQPRQPTQAAPSASPSALRQWITRHPVLTYLLLAYVVGWAIFLVPLFSKEGIGLLPYHVPFVQVFALLASVIALTGSAFLVTALVDGRAGVRVLARRYVRWRVGVQWYLLAVFGLLIVGLLALPVFHGFGSLGALSQPGAALLAFLVQLLVGAVLVHLWEDGGWFGFMFTRLQPRYGALLASLLVAPALGGIHLPLLFITDALTTGRVPVSQYPIDVLQLLVLSSVPFLVLAAWLYNHARGSLLIVALFQSSLDAADGSSLLAKLTYYEGVLAFAVVALLLVVLTRGRLGYKPIPDLQPVAPAS